MMDQKKRQRGGDALSLAATARYGGTFMLKLLAPVGDRRRMFHKQCLTLNHPHQFGKRQAREGARRRFGRATEQHPFSRVQIPVGVTVNDAQVVIDRRQIDIRS
jgi:hypothetical protein